MLERPRCVAAAYPATPLYHAICAAAAEDGEVVRLLLEARPGQERPVLLLAALHDLVLRLVEDAPDSLLDPDPQPGGQDRGQERDLLGGHGRAAQVRHPVDRGKARAAQVDLAQVGVPDVQVPDA